MKLPKLPRHLVTGATGNVGGRVVERLLERGERPRIFVRDAEKARARFGDRVDIVTGDLADLGSLLGALSGIEALFLVNTGPDLSHRDELGAKAAVASGVSRLVKLSSMDARRAGSSTGQWHARGEAAIRASGIAWTFVQPAGFMTNTLAWAASIKAAGTVRAATGEGRIALVSPDDIAAVAACALTSPDYAGQELPLTGPALLTYAEMTAKIGAAIGKHLAFEPISDDQAREGFLRHGMPAAHADALVALARAVREGRLETVTDTAERVLGRKPITYDRWAEEHAAAFR